MQMKLNCYHFKVHYNYKYFMQAVNRHKEMINTQRINRKESKQITTRYHEIKKEDSK